MRMLNAPLRLRSTGEAARKVTWLELFFDLVFVAAVAQVAAPLQTEYSLAGLVRFAPLFGLIWWAWIGHTVFSTRFDSDDVVQRTLTLVQMFAVAAMAANAKEALDTRSSAGFAAAYASVRFLLVTGSSGTPTDQIACRLNLDDPADLESIGDESSAHVPVHLSPALLERISGPDLAIPSLRSATDLAIVERAASLFPPLGSPAGWAVGFGRELNASEDRAAFRPACRPETLESRKGGSSRTRTTYLPIVEGKHVEPFQVALGLARHSVSVADARRLLRSDRHEHPRLAYRDVASATNRLTLIAAVLPAHCVSTHTVFCLRTPLPLHAQHLLCGLFNSFVVNYLVRLRVTTHVTTGTVERLPIPVAEAAPAACREIAGLARLLARRRDPIALARLNARVATLYQLRAGEFEYILATFPLIPAQERQLALKIFLGEAPRH